MELQGTIKIIGETKTFGSNGFRKREMVLTTQEQYPQDLLIEFVQDKCDLLSQYDPGQLVSVGINLRGREWTSPQGEVKYFNSIQGWRIEGQVKETAPPSPSDLPPMTDFPLADDADEKDYDDLPF